MTRQPLSCARHRRSSPRHLAVKWVARPANPSPCRLVMGAQFMWVGVRTPAGMRKGGHGPLRNRL